MKKIAYKDLVGERFWETVRLIHNKEGLEDIDAVINKVLYPDMINVAHVACEQDSNMNF